MYEQTNKWPSQAYQPAEVAATVTTAAPPSFRYAPPLQPIVSSDLISSNDAMDMYVYTVRPRSPPNRSIYLFR